METRMNNPERWVIYGLRDNQDMTHADPRVVYIGKTDDPFRRLKEHAVQALDIVLRWEDEVGRAGQHDEDTNPMPLPFTWWLAGHWRHCFLPDIVILERGTGRQQWRDAEKRWIEAARLLGLYLYNQTAGG